MKKLTNLLPFILLLTILFSACSKDEPVPEEPPLASERVKKINKFIKDVMEDVYLWSEELPDIQIYYELDSKEYFEKLLVEEDKWSYITDDVVALEESFQGIEKTFGWSLAFGTFSNTGNVFALVEFVYPNTPAANAGIKRGDIIVLMNNADITTDNYRDLISSHSLSINLGELTENGIVTQNNAISLSSEKLELNPVLKTSIIEHEGHKIGYLLYTQYISNYNFALDTAIQTMIENNVNNLVVDLRYNPGGTIQSAVHLCSSLAPLSVVNSQNVLTTFNWNDKYQNYFNRNNMTSELRARFNSNVPVKMGLNNIHFLIGQGTASASELTITGLKPYMNSLTLVGEKTHGKYTASITVKPEQVYDPVEHTYYDAFKNWAIQPIVLRYANSTGVTDFKDGFYPDIAVEDDLLLGIPLGTKEEPLLRAAIEDITGTQITAMKSAELPHFDYKIMDRGFSRFDGNKRQLILDNLEATPLKLN